MRLLLAAVLACTLPACDRAPDQPDTAPAPGSTVTTAPSTATAREQTAAAAVTPKPTEPRTFGDWAVACDNVRTCTLASLGPEAGDFPPVTLAATRQPGPDGGWSLAFETVGDAPPVRPVAAIVDGRRLALPGLDGMPAAALVAAMANGTSLGIVEAGGPRRATIPLKGAAAALRWIDAEQGRAGTITATVARGAAPAATVPARAAPPIVTALIPSGTPQAPTPPQLAEMTKQAGCDDPIVRNAGLTPEVHALGGGATLVMLPCSTGAYNLSSALFVLRDGRVAPARTDAPSGFGPTPVNGTDRLPSVVNGEWIEGELREFPRGRGLGDCGVRQTYVWDGTRLRLTAQSVMGECRGNPHFLTTWRTQVVRR